MLMCKATNNPLEVNIKLGEDSESLWWIRAYINDWLDG